MYNYGKLEFSHFLPHCHLAYRKRGTERVPRNVVVYKSINDTFITIDDGVLLGMMYHSYEQGIMHQWL